MVLCKTLIFKLFDEGKLFSSSMFFCTAALQILFFQIDYFPIPLNMILIIS